ncbi:ABC transporter ATP-binding protein [Paenibacillus sp. H1-7]|uniref:ribosomal protection-like ABC-F family protein n=1 Tax=Paenibacillus sp. H1-7 TaxID=2282849 RepID=UPI001EF7996A|nr:ABC-F family ATP-binding cassette domain-containing protein [Paenibacillus sp. H1-7]ULL15352.1 ABC transporter ATP-binding protein [Paenibacillus sp. H1-7]
MLLLEARRIKQTIGDRLLFAADMLRIGEQDRIGIVGPNGAGKTTLMTLLAGGAEPDEGTVATKAARQMIPQLKQESEQGSVRSGGEITSMYIERAFDAMPDILFADEPTMHLDIEAIKDLEQKCIRYKGAIVLISHDRTFLDKVCSVIWEIAGQKITVYKGNYTAYYEQKQLEARQHQERFEEYVRKKADLERAIRIKRHKADTMLKAPKGTNTSEWRLAKDKKGSTQAGVHQSIKALETRIEKLEKVEKPREAAQVKIDLPGSPAYKNQTVIRLERLEAKVGSRQLWKDVSLGIPFGEKVALIGPNGSGKTTLLKKIVAREDGVAIAPGVKLGYFSQNLDILDRDATIMDCVLASSVQPDALVRTVLARLLFTGDDVFKKVGVLSGGERVRVALAKIFLSDITVLIMDEPTNFLDIESVEALEQLFIGYSGTILFVTHDRMFVERTATRILEITAGAIVSYDGTYREYADSGKKPGDQRNVDSEELLTVEMKLTELVSKLGEPLLAGEKEALEEQFQRMVRRRKELRAKLQ